MITSVRIKLAFPNLVHSCLRAKGRPSSNMVDLDLLFKRTWVIQVCVLRFGFCVITSLRMKLAFPDLIHSCLRTKGRPTSYIVDLDLHFKVTGVIQVWVLKFHFRMITSLRIELALPYLVHGCLCRKGRPSSYMVDLDLFSRSQGSFKCAS